MLSVEEFLHQHPVRISEADDTAHTAPAADTPAGDTVAAVGDDVLTGDVAAAAATGSQVHTQAGLQPQTQPDSQADTAEGTTNGPTESAVPQAPHVGSFGVRSSGADADADDADGVDGDSADADSVHDGGFGNHGFGANDGLYGARESHGFRKRRGSRRGFSSRGHQRQRHPGGFQARSGHMPGAYSSNKHAEDEAYDAVSADDSLLAGDEVSAGNAGNAGNDTDTDNAYEALGSCRQAALTILDAAARSTGALRDRLLAKGYRRAVADEVIMRLVRVSLLDDDAYAQSVIRYCSGRMYGKRGVLRELQRKGVDPSVAEPLVEQADRQGVFVDAAWELGRSVAAKTVGLDPLVRKRRFWSAGGRRGHDAQTLRDVQHDLFDRHME